MGASITTLMSAWITTLMAVISVIIRKRSPIEYEELAIRHQQEFKKLIADIDKFKNMMRNHDPTTRPTAEFLVMINQLYRRKEALERENAELLAEIGVMGWLY